MQVFDHFFISYSRESSADSQFALKLAKDLKAAGIDTWIDQLDLESGQSVDEVMTHSSSLLVVLSPESVRSQQVQKEVAFARARGRWLDAVLFRTCELRGPFEFREPFDFRTDYQAGLKELLQFIRESLWGEEAEPDEGVDECMSEELTFEDLRSESEEAPAISREQQPAQSQPQHPPREQQQQQSDPEGMEPSVGQPAAKPETARKKAAKKSGAPKLERVRPPQAYLDYELGAASEPPPAPASQPASLARDNVQFTLTGPSALAPGEPHELLFWVHLEEQRATVLVRAASELGLSSSEISVNSEGPYPLERGSRLSVRMTIGGLNCVDDHKWITWTGEIGKTTFIVDVPSGTPEGTHIGSASIRFNDCEIARMSFLVRVGAAAAGVQQIPSTTTAHRKAFASYASQDRVEVLGRVQGMEAAWKGLDVFVDVMSLRSGENWEAELVKHISEADVFYLFWCQHAKASEWVTKEWRLALQAKGLDFIDPVPLEPPTEAPPPPELAAKHFNDPVLAFIKAAGGHA